MKDEFYMKGMIKIINLWLDDLRPAPDGFIWVETVSQLIYKLDELKELDQEINIMSLDHDLGENEPTGYDFVKYLVEVGNYEPSYYPRQIYLHTANPVGRENMYQLLMRYKPDNVKVYKSSIPQE